MAHCSGPDIVKAGHCRLKRAKLGVKRGKGATFAPFQKGVAWREADLQAHTQCS